MISKKNITGLKARKEISEKYKWQIEDMYSSIAEWQRDFDYVKNSLGEVEPFKIKLKKQYSVLGDLLNIYAVLSEKSEKLFVFAHMKKDEDNTDPESQSLLDKAQSLLVEVEGIFSFMVPGILEMPGKTLEKLIESDQNLKDYRHFIEDIIRQKEHVLSPEEEKILALSGEIASAPQQIFTMLNNADIKFPAIKNEEGNKVELTKGRYMKFLESKNRKIRKAAFGALYKTYRKQINTISTALNYSIKKDIFFARNRRYQSTLQASLFSDNVPEEVYDNLINSVSKNLVSMHKYMKLRKKILGLKKLHSYDLYVPLIKDIELKIPYEEAREIVIKSIQPLGLEYTDQFRKGLNSGWIDVFENTGKTSGAYSWGCYDTHPFVLLNYEENLDNLYTLAHEMGHSMHTFYSNKAQPYIKAGYKIFVAEVASIMNEILLTEYLLKNLDEELKKLLVLNHYLEQFRGTVFRQTMFAEFEKIIHGNAGNGIPLTAKSLSDIYHALNEKYYGPGLVIDNEINIEWARIPHFYSSFYVYKYALGFAAGVALSKKIIKNEGDSVMKYLEFLAAGGSDYPVSLLKNAGVDMNSPEPIEDALEIFNGLVDKMQELIFIY